MTQKRQHFDEITYVQTHTAQTRGVQSYAVVFLLHSTKSNHTHRTAAWMAGKAWLLHRSSASVCSDSSENTCARPTQKSREPQGLRQFV